MTSVFVFSLIVGGGLLALSLLGDLFGGGDVDADFDADFDTDLGADVDVDAGGDADVSADSVEAGGATDLAGAIRIFTIRNLTYFLFGFGAVGWLLERLQPELPLWVVTLAALVAGVLAGGLSAVVFGWLRATDAGWQADESSYVGCEGRVVLPVGHGKVGQIVVRRGDREHELRAVPFDARAESPERWRAVVVIEMDGGTARVSPMEALAPAGDGLAES